MFRSLLELLAYLLLFLIVRSAIRAFASARRPPAQSQPRPDIPSGGELKKDPVCGAYVSPAASLQRQVKGQTIYFCSETCRDRYAG